MGLLCGSVSIAFLRFGVKSVAYTAFMYGADGGIIDMGVHSLLVREFVWVSGDCVILRKSAIVSYGCISVQHLPSKLAIAGLWWQLDGAHMTALFSIHDNMNTIYD